jgi:Leucine-rich repeat (LRR) protein
LEYLSRCNLHKLVNLNVGAAIKSQNGDAMKEFAKWKLDGLTNLSLKGMEADPTDLQLFSKMNWPNLIELKMEAITLFAGQQSYLTKAKMPQLKRLEIKSCYLGYLDTHHLVEFDLPNLEELVVTQNYLNTTNIKDLLSKTSSKLKILQLSDNSLDLFEVLKVVPDSLVELRLDGNMLKFDNDIELMRKFIALKKLDLHNNELLDESIALILSYPYVLEELNLGKMGVK